MKYYLVFLVIFYSTPGIAGGSSAGGTPPALQELLEQLSLAPGSGGIFLESDRIGLGVNVELKSELTVTKDHVTPQSVRVTNVDFSVLVEKKGTIDVENTEGAVRSYRVDDGEMLDTLSLKDRRELIRPASLPNE